MIGRRLHRFLQDGWDINGLALMHHDAQWLGEACGRHGLDDAGGHFAHMHAAAGRNAANTRPCPTRAWAIGSGTWSRTSATRCPWPPNPSPTPTCRASPTTVAAAKPRRPTTGGAGATTPRPTHRRHRSAGCRCRHAAPEPRPSPQRRLPHVRALADADAKPHADSRAEAPRHPTQPSAAGQRARRPRSPPARRPVAALAPASASTTSPNTARCRWSSTSAWKPLGYEVELLETADELRELLGALPAQPGPGGCRLQRPARSHRRDRARSPRAQPGSRVLLVALSQADDINLRLTASRAGVDSLVVDPNGASDVLRRLALLLDPGQRRALPHPDRRGRPQPGAVRRRHPAQRRHGNHGGARAAGRAGSRCTSSSPT